MVAPKAPGHRVRELYVSGAGTPGLVAIAAGRERQRAGARARVRRRHRLRPRRPARDDVRGGDRERPLRRAGRALRRRPRARAGGLRHARRGGLPAGDRVLRVPERAEADRRPDVRGRLRVHALLDLGRRGVRRSLASGRASSTTACASGCRACSTTSAAAAFAKELFEDDAAGRPQFKELREQGAGACRGDREGRQGAARARRAKSARRSLHGVS